MVVPNTNYISKLIYVFNFIMPLENSFSSLVSLTLGKRLIPRQGMEDRDVAILYLRKDRIGV